MEEENQDSSNLHELLMSKVADNPNVTPNVHKPGLITQSTDKFNFNENKDIDKVNTNKLNEDLSPLIRADTDEMLRSNQEIEEKLKSETEPGSVEENQSLDLSMENDLKNYNTNYIDNIVNNKEVLNEPGSIYDDDTSESNAGRFINDQNSVDLLDMDISHEKINEATESELFGLSEQYKSVKPNHLSIDDVTKQLSMSGHLNEQKGYSAEFRLSEPPVETDYKIMLNNKTINNYDTDHDNETESNDNRSNREVFIANRDSFDSGRGNGMGFNGSIDDYRD